MKGSLTKLDWLPWPIGTHWCVVERVKWQIAGALIVLNVVVTVVALIVEALG